MKIWFPTIRAGTGADVFIINLARGLMKIGIEAEITWFPHLSEIFPYPLRYARVPNNVDIIHANSWYGFAFSRFNIPVVISVFHWVHDSDLLPYKSFLQKAYHDYFIKRYENSSIRNATVITTISKYTGAQLQKEFPDNKIIIINNGIDTNLFIPETSIKKDGSKFNLFYAGTPSKRKGFDLIGPILEKLPSNIYLNYTDGYINNNKAQKLGKLNLSQLISAYQSCDALLFPSRYEGFGYVVAEAMACGKPVVTSNCSALPELVENMKTGILCPVDDVPEFVASIMQLYKNRILAEKMGMAARQKVVEEYSLENMINEYIKLYKSII